MKTFGQILDNLTQKATIQRNEIKITAGQGVGTAGFEPATTRPPAPLNGFS